MLTALCFTGLIASAYMTGVVWYAQLVHYPLLNRGEDFVSFAVEYQRRTFWVVAPGLITEIIATLGLVLLYPNLMTWLGLAALGGVWALTLGCQIPQHLRLKSGYDAETHRNLVRMNAPRSVLWTLRTAIMVWTTINMT